MFALIDIQINKTFTKWSNEIWSQKIILNFENYLFLTALTQKILQGIKKIFDCAHWGIIKIYWILPDTPWNSTTVTLLLPATRYEAASIVVKMPNQTTSWENEMKCLAYILWSCNWWHLTMNADTVHPMATNHNY